MPLTTNLSIVNNYSNPLSAGTGGTLTDAFSDSVSYSFTAGSGVYQVNLPWSAAATLTNASATFILSALAGPGASTTALTTVRKVILHNTATATGNTLTIAPGGTHPWNTGIAGAVTVPAGGAFVLASPIDGLSVASGSADQITITATGTVPYKLSIEGA